MDFILDGVRIMYRYPIDNLEKLSRPFAVSPEDHSMGNSLVQYMEIKIHQLLKEYNYEKIVVQGKFDRSSGISYKEKTNKLFNYIRPTAQISDEILYLNCFPGLDYVFHYGNVIKSYLSLMQKPCNVSGILPSEEVCWTAIAESDLKSVSKSHTVIMGYVEGLQNISSDTIWHGTGNFLWKSVCLSSGDAILLGCKHTYWGEIAGRIVCYLALNGVKRIIYSGKLGTLNPNLIPNLTIATGNSSILPNGKVIEWDNLFDGITDSQIYYGRHITVPSVMQETKKWLKANCGVADFVDPEIGHMALAAANYGVEFSYLHIISDNLSHKYEFDLSNERKTTVIQNRSTLFRKIREAITRL